jgi:hypothetical protein
MTAKEKAEDLVNKFFQFKPRFKLDIDNEKEYYQAKQCALIAVDEIISDYKNYLFHANTEYKGLMYWKEVKQELDKL